MDNSQFYGMMAFNKQILKALEEIKEDLKKLNKMIEEQHELEWKSMDDCR